MLGEHQKENAALAITALIELNERQIIELDFNKMIDGIESVNWTGRIEQVKEQPLMVVDGAHNNESIDALVDTIRHYYGRDKIDILFSAIKGKPIHSMINKLNDIASKFYIADFEFPKALAKEEIAEELKLDNLHLIDDYVDFIENYEGDGLIITGSLYFISEVKAKINFN